MSQERAWEIDMRHAAPFCVWALQAISEVSSFLYYWWFGNKSTVLSKTAFSLTGNNRSSRSLTRHQPFAGFGWPFCALNILVHLRCYICIPNALEADRKSGTGLSANSFTTND